MLEGENVIPIAIGYNKKGKCYVATVLPGYNTVIVKSEKYSEKGFQDRAGLPAVLRMKLYTPYRVQVPGDSLNYYKEIPNKIAAVFNFSMTENIDPKEYLKKNYPELAVEDCKISGFFKEYIVLAKKSGEDFRRFNDPSIAMLSVDKNILFLEGFLLKTKIRIQQPKSEKAYFDEAGNPKYFPKFLDYSRYDTIAEALYYKNSRKHYMLSVPALRKNTYRHVPPENLPYKEKLKRGLLIGNVYTIERSALKRRYAADLKQRQCGFFNFKYQKDTLTQLAPVDRPYMPEIAMDEKEIPYITISASLKYTDIMQSPDGMEVYYAKSENGYESIYQRRKNIIKFENVGVQNTKVYSLKNIVASPFGVMDMIEFHNGTGENICQNIEYHINQY